MWRKVSVVAIALVGLLALGIFVVRQNISESYPIAEVCRDIRAAKVQTGVFPPVHEVLEEIEPVRALSVLRYWTTETGFVLYHCPTKLGPCEVCTESEDTHFEEI